ncbi:Squalene epoxidase [Kalmusia sp. IMI 367209]|nr:Squalene epoxidase [Kalmusia sp. IMI 367209]
MGKHYDIIIVGAGIAGSAAATTLARQGYEVLLLERSLKEPDRIVGELLQPGGMIALEKLGLASAVEDIEAIPVRGYHIYWKNEEVTFYYPSLSQYYRKKKSSPYHRRSSGTEDHYTRPEGRSFHHGRFLSRLRELAQSETRVTTIETTATTIVTDKQTGRVIGVDCIKKGKYSKVYYSNLTVVADGASSNLRPQLWERRALAKSRFWSLELKDVKLPHHGLAYGSIGNGPPILIYQISARSTRILIDIPNSVHAIVPQMGDIRTYVRDIVVPTLPEAFRFKTLRALTSGRLRSMPNEWLPAQINKTPGVIAIGDACNIRHPLTGSGMTVALNDVVLLRDLLAPSTLDLNNIDSMHRRLQGFHRKRRVYSSSLNILAQALYALFVATDPQLEVIQRGFIRYIQYGGKYVEEPSGLMGGIYHSRLLLIRHFFAIAIYSMWLLIQESPLWMLPVSVVKCAHVFGAAVSVILPFILSEL